MAYRKFSEEQKRMWVKKFLSRGSKSIDVFCRESALSSTAVYKWVAIYGRTDDMKTLIRTPQSWTAEEKFKAVIGFDTLAIEDQGAYLRREGVHADHIELWREKMQKSLELESSDKKTERGELLYKILDLEKDLARKDKALAEAAAIIILKKKVDLIWGKEDLK
jgi:transposase-like protein